MFEPETSGLHSKPALSTIVRVPSSTDKNKTHRRTRTVNNEESFEAVIKYKNIFEPFKRKKSNSNVRQKASAVGGGLTRAKKIHFRGFEVSGWKLFSSSLRSPYHSVNQTPIASRGARAPSRPDLGWNIEPSLHYLWPKPTTRLNQKIESES